MSAGGAEREARLFHETYERLAPEFGYETRKESAVPWEQVPERNRKLMIAVCEIVAARCANEARLEALEQAAALADRADSSGMVFAGKTVPVAYAIRALKEATP